MTSIVSSYYTEQNQKDKVHNKYEACEKYN